MTELCDDESTFVVVLIDEVESLTAARAGAMSGKEPSDALRVVNALLTQLDKLKLRKNVLVLTTSNLSAAIGESSSPPAKRHDDGIPDTGLHRPRRCQALYPNTTSPGGVRHPVLVLS